MTIGELFVKIGFISDTKALAAVRTEIKDVTANATKLTFAVDAVVTAMTGLMYFSANLAVGPNKFGISTGESTDELQRWQYAAAGFNVKGAQVTNTIMGIRQAQAAIRLNQGNVGPWQFFGISANQDPFQVLLALHDRIKGLRDPGQLGVAQLMAIQMGITPDMFSLLVRTDMKLGDLQKKFMASKQEIDDLAALNAQWEQMIFKVERLGIKLAHDLAPAFHKVFDEVYPILERIANKLAWLGGNSEDAKKQRDHLQELAKGVLAVGAAFTALTLILKGATLASATFEIANSPIIAGMAELAASLGTIYYIYKAIAHPQTSAERSLNREDFADEIGYRRNRSVWDKYGFGGTMTGRYGTSPNNTPDMTYLARSLGSLFFGQKGDARTVAQNIYNTFHIDNKDPAAVAREIQRLQKNTNSAVAGQMAPAG